MQGVNEDIEHYIHHKEGIVQNMGRCAPSEFTQKQKFIDGLREPEAQMFVSLKTPTNLTVAKQEARNWEEIETNRMHQHESREKAITSLASSKIEPIDSFHVEKPNQERKERENTKRHDLMQGKVDALQKQLEEEPMVHSILVKDRAHKWRYVIGRRLI